MLSVRRLAEGFAVGRLVRLRADAPVHGIAPRAKSLIATKPRSSNLHCQYELTSKPIDSLKISDDFVNCPLNKVECFDMVKVLGR